MKKTMGIMLICTLLFIPWIGQAQTWQDSFETQIQTWVKELSEQDDRFAPFHHAEIRYVGLGPHSQQWLVTFTSAEKELGYMVVGEHEEGFVLFEYGLGEYTLFDEAAVAPFSTDQSMTPFYAGLHSVWISPQGIYDAKTGEKYPEESVIPEDGLSSFIRKEAVLNNTYQKNIGEEEVWLKPEHALSDVQSLMDQLPAKETSLIAHLFNKTVIAPFAVIGYHQWSQEIFIEFEDVGSRVFPFNHAKEWGVFVQ